MPKIFPVLILTGAKSIVWQEIQSVPCLQKWRALLMKAAYESTLKFMASSEHYYESCPSSSLSAASSSWSNICKNAKMQASNGKMQIHGQILLGCGTCLY